jgi:hypothetical protein
MGKKKFAVGNLAREKELTRFFLDGWHSHPTATTKPHDHSLFFAASHFQFHSNAYRFLCGNIGAHMSLLPLGKGVSFLLIN